MFKGSIMVRRELQQQHPSDWLSGAGTSRERSSAVVVTEHIDGLVQERRNSSALAMELRLSCTNPSLSTNTSSLVINTWEFEQNGQHFADVNFKCVFLNDNQYIFIQISLKFDPKGPGDNKPALSRVMAWYSTGDKPLSESMMITLCDVIRPHNNVKALNLKWTPH